MSNIQIENYEAVGPIGNYYGGLNIGIKDGKFYWSIEDWSGFEWEEIPESLYKELLKVKENPVD